MRISDWSSDVCSSDLLRRQARQLGDVKAIAAVGRAIGKLVQEDEVALPLARPDMMQGQRVEPFGKPRQFMIMGGEQAAPAAHVVDRLKHRPGDRQSVIGGRAAPDLVKDHERSRSRSEEPTSELQPLMRISYA